MQRYIIECVAKMKRKKWRTEDKRVYGGASIPGTRSFSLFTLYLERKIVAFLRALAEIIISRDYCCLLLQCTFHLAYSSLNSANLNFSSEVTLTELSAWCERDKSCGSGKWRLDWNFNQSFSQIARDIYAVWVEIMATQVNSKQGRGYFFRIILVPGICKISMNELYTVSV